MLIEPERRARLERDAQESYVPRELARERLEESRRTPSRRRDARERARGPEARFTEVQASSMRTSRSTSRRSGTAARERIEAQARELVTQRQAARQRLQEHRATAAETLRAAQAHWDAERSASEERAALALDEQQRSAAARAGPTRVASRTPSGDARYRRPRSRRQSRR